jgi:uncharacterized membrane protein YfcA
MLEFGLALLILSASIAYAAWREFRNDNRRDAALLGSFAGSGSLLGAVLCLS